MAIDESVIEELKAKHGQVVHLKYSDDEGNLVAEVLVKKPSRPAYKRFRSECHIEARRADAGETLMKDAVVYPTLPEWEKMLDAYPALAETFLGNVLALLGGGPKADADVKKY